MKAIYQNFFKKGNDVNPIIQVLENVPIFEHLTEKELSEVVRLTHERTFKKDEHVFKKLAPAEGMYVILDGGVLITDSDSETVFATLESGDFFGELALITGHKRVASAVTFTDCKLHTMSKEAFDANLLHSVKFMRKILEWKSFNKCIKCISVCIIY